MDFQYWLQIWGKRIYLQLQKFRTTQGSTAEQAAWYALDQGFKFYRPLVCLAVIQTYEEDPAKHLSLACAMQAIHCASLILDDLPCFDNSPIRRGVAACHIKFGEAKTILASHLLITFADRMIIEAYPPVRSIVYKKIRDELDVTLENMIRGQNNDISKGSQITASLLGHIRAAKTGSLYAFCAVTGGIVSPKANPCLKWLRSYGLNLGTAYQILDDLRDQEGLPDDKERLQQCKEKARAALKQLGRPAPLLEYLLQEIVPST